MPKQILQLDFPIKGLNENTAYAKTVPQTCASCLNVRPYDPLEGRARGGSRPGTQKLLASAVNGTSPIQSIVSGVLALDPSAIVPDTLLLNHDFSTLSTGRLTTVDAANWDYDTQCASSDERTFNPLLSAVTTDYLNVATVSGTQTLQTNQTGGSTSVFHSQVAALHSVVTLGTAYALRATLRLAHVNSQYAAAGSFPANPEARGAAGGILFRAAAATGASRQSIAVVFASTGTLGEWLLYLVKRENTTYSYIAQSSFFVVPYTSGSFSDLVTLEVRVNGDFVQAFTDGILRLTGSVAGIYPGNVRVGLGATHWQYSTHTPILFHTFSAYTGVSPASLRTTKLVVASGGTVKVGSISTGLNTAASGTAAVRLDGRVQGIPAFQKVYYADGLNYKVLDLATEVVSTWAATSGTLPAGSTNVSYTITTIDSGGLKFNISGSVDPGYSAGDIIVVLGNSKKANNKTYKVASSSTTQVILNSATPIPDVTGTGGTLAKANNVPTMGCLYRGRIVLAGLSADPQNWFMSKAGDPLDWDYAPSVINETQAVAGNNSDAGLLGDIITCLIPFSDDNLIMGGDHTIWMMRGDPAAGGRIDNISYQTGIVGPEAFAWDDFGTLYFMGIGGVYRMQSMDSQPELMTSGKIDERLAQIDYGANAVRMVWERQPQILHIYITPINVGAHTHYLWDRRTDSWWVEQYPNNFGPTAVCMYDADSPSDRVLILGGFDSYLRRYEQSSDSNKGSDDGGAGASVAITSYVRYQSIFANPLLRQRLELIQVNLDTASDPVALRVIGAESPEAAVKSSTIRFSGTVTSLRGKSFRQRCTDNAICIELRNTTAAKRWALETLSAVMDQAGVQRRIKSSGD